MSKICSNTRFVNNFYILCTYNWLYNRSIEKFRNFSTSNMTSAESITEGSATIYVTNAKSTDVFYNPVQQFNRDMSVATINQFIQDRKNDTLIEGKDGLTVLEALSATGLRSIRYAKEIPGCKKIIANDFLERAVKAIDHNIQANGVQDKVIASHADAAELMSRHKHPDKRFDIVDLDPYGAPVQFLDGAIQSVADGGLLCVTCTDMAVLCGNAAETCYTKYGAVSLRGKNGHEHALRIVLQCIEAHANRYGRYIEPLLSLSIDFYVRIFVRVFTSQKKCKETSSKLGHVYRCTGCETMTTQPLGELVKDEKNNVKYVLPKGPPVDRKCKFCQHSHIIGGPYWIAPIHDMDFVSRLSESLANCEHLGTRSRMEGMLALVNEELPDVPFYYLNDRLCSMVKVKMAKYNVFRSAFLNAGYRISGSHANKAAIKTDAPPEFIWDMIRAYAKGIPSNPENRTDVAKAILERENPFSIPPVEIDFTENENAEPPSRKLKLLRFQQNPPNWGPKSKARKFCGTDEVFDKREKNQGKHSGKRQFEVIEEANKKEKLDNGVTEISP